MSNCALKLASNTSYVEIIFMYLHPDSKEDGHLIHLCIKYTFHKQWRGMQFSSFMHFNCKSILNKKKMFHLMKYLTKPSYPPLVTYLLQLF